MSADRDRLVSEAREAANRSLSRKEYGRMLLALADALQDCERKRERLQEAAGLVTSYYDYHAEPGEPPCPCAVCERARPYFHSLLAAFPPPEEPWDGATGMRDEF